MDRDRDSIGIQWKSLSLFLYLSFFSLLLPWRLFSSLSVERGNEPTQVCSSLKSSHWFTFCFLHFLFSLPLSILYALSLLASYFFLFSLSLSQKRRRNFNSFHQIRTPFQFIPFQSSDLSPSSFFLPMKILSLSLSLPSSELTPSERNRRDKKDEKERRMKIHCQQHQNIFRSFFQYFSIFSSIFLLSLHLSFVFFFSPSFFLFFHNSSYFFLLNFFIFLSSSFFFLVKPFSTGNDFWKIPFSLWNKENERRERRKRERKRRKKVHFLFTKNFVFKNVFLFSEKETFFLIRKISFVKTGSKILSLSEYSLLSFRTFSYFF